MIYHHLYIYLSVYVWVCDWKRIWSFFPAVGRTRAQISKHATHHSITHLAYVVCVCAIAWNDWMAMARAGRRATNKNHQTNHQHWITKSQYNNTHFTNDDAITPCAGEIEWNLKNQGFSAIIFECVGCRFFFLSFFHLSLLFNCFQYIISIYEIISSSSTNQPTNNNK